MLVVCVSVCVHALWFVDLFSSIHIHLDPTTTLVLLPTIHQVLSLWPASSCMPTQFFVCWIIIAIPPHFSYLTEAQLVYCIVVPCHLALVEEAHMSRWQKDLALKVALYQKSMTAIRDLSNSTVQGRSNQSQ